MSDDSHEYDADDFEFIEDERVRIAALHATCPKVIWLQVDPEAEQFDGWDAQTWCSDKINDTDVCYVLGTSRDAEIAELKAALQAVSDDWDGEHFHNGGSSFMPVVNAALGRGEQEWT